MDPSERPRERLAEHGPEYLSNAELLAIVLRTGTRHANAVDLAQALLTRFGGLTGLADADITALTEVPGIGPAKATEIKSALEVGRRLLLARAGEKPRVTGASDAAAILGPLIRNLEQETLRVRDLFRSAVRRNCAAVILAHNHPSGDPTPSADDLRLTEAAIQAGNLLGIKVLDHLVIGKTGGGFISIREAGNVDFALD